MACCFVGMEEQAREKLGVKSLEDETVSIGWGMLIKKTDFDKYKGMITRQNKELNDAIENDKTGEGFVKDMFKYEMANHEFCITLDPSDTLRSLGISWEKLVNTPNLWNGWKLAKKEYLANVEWY